MLKISAVCVCEGNAAGTCEGLLQTAAAVKVKVFLF